MLSCLWLSNIPFCICTTTSLPTRWVKMTSSLLPCTSYCKQCCSEQWDTCVFFNFGFLSVYAQEWDCWVIWLFYFQFFKESLYHLPSWLYQLTFPPTVLEGSLCSTFSPAFIVYGFFDDGHSDWCEVISHCSFNLHFSNNEQC